MNITTVLMLELEKEDIPSVSKVDGTNALGKTHFKSALSKTGL